MHSNANTRMNNAAVLEMHITIMILLNNSGSKIFINNFIDFNLILVVVARQNIQK